MGVLTTPKEDLEKLLDRHPELALDAVALSVDKLEASVDEARKRSDRLLHDVCTHLAECLFEMHGRVSGKNRLFIERMALYRPLREVLPVLGLDHDANSSLAKKTHAWLQELFVKTNATAHGK